MFGRYEGVGSHVEAPFRRGLVAIHVVLIKFAWFPARSRRAIRTGTDRVRWMSVRPVGCA